MFDLNRFFLHINIILKLEKLSIFNNKNLRAKVVMDETNNSNKKSIAIPLKNISLKVKHPMFLRHPIYTWVFACIRI